MKPTTSMSQMSYRNPHATADLILPVLVVCNTPDEELTSNIHYSAALDLPWVGLRTQHEREIVLCGGGPSIADHLNEIRQHQANGATVWAMNAAAQFLRQHGIEADAQVIADAKPETVSLYDPESPLHYIASQCDRQMFEQKGQQILWHLAISEDMDKWFPKAKRQAGGYSLIGGGASVGNSAMCIAYVLGYRTLHLYGYDSSHKNDESHAYQQEMNRFIPTVNVEWGGVTYKTSVAMKAQAEKFQFTAQSLKRMDCTINIYGDGLLPAMWNTDPADMTERDKYRMLWHTDMYRSVSPGEGHADLIYSLLEPDSLVLDFGCGTGRAALELHKRGVDVLLIDFADNCRDEEAMVLPFLEWDLTHPLPPSAKFGMCCDVMEHIPPDDVAKVLENIMNSASRVFFNISTTQDFCGALIHDELHLTVRPAEWWANMLLQFGTIEWQQSNETEAMFVVQRTIQ